MGSPPQKLMTTSEPMTRTGRSTRKWTFATPTTRRRWSARRPSFPRWPRASKRSTPPPSPPPPPPGMIRRTIRPRRPPTPPTPPCPPPEWHCRPRRRRRRRRRSRWRTCSRGRGTATSAPSGTRRRRSSAGCAAVPRGTSIRHRKRPRPPSHFVPARLRSQDSRPPPPRRARLEAEICKVYIHRATHANFRRAPPTTVMRVIFSSSH
mmetsp:Transcript_8266/g.27136  ORF Transcript_8266/g.27136 Transcript_8266/m.27136 type:complete len:207 (-) Transcript_8266:864-1484(-)